MQVINYDTNKENKFPLSHQTKVSRQSAWSQRMCKHNQYRKKEGVHLFR